MRIAALASLMSLACGQQAVQPASTQQLQPGQFRVFGQARQAPLSVPGTQGQVVSQFIDENGAAIPVQQFGQPQRFAPAPQQPGFTQQQLQQFQATQQRVAPQQQQRVAPPQQQRFVPQQQQQFAPQQQQRFVPQQQQQQRAPAPVQKLSEQQAHQGHLAVQQQQIAIQQQQFSPEQRQAALIAQQAAANPPPQQQQQFQPQQQQFQPQQQQFQPQQQQFQPQQATQRRPAPVPQRRPAPVPQRRPAPVQQRRPAPAAPQQQFSNFGSFPAQGARPQAAAPAPQRRPQAAAPAPRARPQEPGSVNDELGNQVVVAEQYEHDTAGDASLSRFQLFQLRKKAEAAGGAAPQAA